MLEIDHNCPWCGGPMEHPQRMCKPCQGEFYADIPRSFWELRPDTRYMVARIDAKNFTQDTEKK